MNSKQAGSKSFWNAHHKKNPNADDRAWFCRLRVEVSTGWCKRNVPCLKIPAPTAATHLGLPWTAQSADFGKFHLNSLNLAPFLLLNPVWYEHKGGEGGSQETTGKKSHTIGFSKQRHCARSRTVRSPHFLIITAIACLPSTLKIGKKSWPRSQYLRTSLGFLQPKFNAA